MIKQRRDCLITTLFTIILNGRHQPEVWRYFRKHHLGYILYIVINSHSLCPTLISCYGRNNRGLLRYFQVLQNILEKKTRIPSIILTARTPAFENYSITVSQRNKRMAGKALRFSEKGSWQNTVFQRQNLFLHRLKEFM